LAWLTLVLVAAGCGDTLAGDETGSIEEPIVNGTNVTTDLIGTPKFLNNYNGGTCTSTLLRDRWLLTAYHCVSIDGATKNPPAPLSSFEAWVGNTKATVARIFYPGLPAQVPTMDVALVKLASALPAPPGHAEPWDIPLFSGSSSSLVGNSYYCQGWGYNTCNQQGLGVLRSAVLPVTSSDATGFTITPNQFGQTTTDGDSGSSCYQVANGRYHVLGVLSNGECGSHGNFLGASSIRDWVDSILDRVGVIDHSTGAFRVKEGGLDQAWLSNSPGAFLASISGPRVAMIRQSDQRCLVKEGAFVNSWVDQGFAGVVRCFVDGARIGVLTQDGTFRVKEGSVSSSGWVNQDTFVSSAVLSGNRIGIIKNNRFYVKEGALGASWVEIAQDVQQGLLSGTRIGYRLTSGSFRVKDGSVSSTGFVTQSTGVTQAALSGNRIGVLKTDGSFQVREGSVSPVTGWVQQDVNVSQVVLSGKRIGAVVNMGTPGTPWYRYQVKEGSLSAIWAVQIEGNQAGYTPVLPSK
jgi:hypothetical protein